MATLKTIISHNTTFGDIITDAGVIGSDVPWLDCPACNALTWVITVTVIINMDGVIMTLMEN